MHPLRLPEATQRVTASMEKEWLNALSQQDQEDVEALFALRQEIIALDCSATPVENKIERAETLRAAVAPFVERLSPLFSRTPLPQNNTEHAVFILNTSTLKHLALIYLRALSILRRKKNIALLGFVLHRVALIVRHWQWHYFLSNRMPPKESLTWLLYTLNLGNLHQVLHIQYHDPAALEFGKSSTGGQVAWALMVIAASPAHLNLKESKVLQRVSARWREMVGIHHQKQTEYAVSFSDLYPQTPSQKELCWMDFSFVLKKINQRIAALNNGQTPAQIKLGKDLESNALKNLLQVLKERFQKALSFPQAPAQDIRATTSTFYFNAFQTYPALFNRAENKEARFETWKVLEGLVWRDVANPGARYVAPHLVVSDSPLRLGVLSALCEDAYGGLFSDVSWFEQHLEFGHLNLEGLQQAFFFASNATQSEILVEAESPLTLHQTYATFGCSQKQFTVVELLEEGADFLRYRVQ